jgi:amino acid transporter
MTTTVNTMTTTVNTTRVANPSTGALARDGVAATVAASAATMTVAAAGHAAGVSLDMGGAPIPVLGFGVLTAVFSLVGLVLAAVLSHTARNPQRTFIRITVVLTALSLVPDVIADAGPATKGLLMLTHLVAAAIVIPAVARRLRG